LLDSSGKVIGVNTAIESGATGIGFAVPSDTVTRVLTSLKAGKTIVRPWLGISGTDLNATKAATLGISVNQGIYVVSVVSGSPAATAGLKAGSTDSQGNLTTGGDVITAVDGNAFTKITDLSAYISKKQVGDTVTLTVLRDGQYLTVQATLTAWPTQTTTTYSIPDDQQMPSLPDQQDQWPWNHNRY